MLALSFGGATLGMGSPPSAFGQGPPAAAPIANNPQQDRLTQAQLEQLLAPIALYPDELLMQMLMASTYPLEVVQAYRWLSQGQNAQLRGDALVQALSTQSWDPSVKSLVPFPDLLKLMNDQLEWTQQVGDAVLAQQQDVLNAMQVLRGRAQANGALRSGPQQTVNVVQNTNAAAPAQGSVVTPPSQIITIAPTQPETVYVPAYDPNVVYGAWPYPQSPPAYYPPPASWGVGSALLTGMAFAGGVAIIGSLAGWSSAGWGGGDINVNASRYNNINANRNQISGNQWRHDTTHRQGVAYRSDDVRNRVNANRPDGARAGAADRERAQSRDQFRGRMDQTQRGQGLADRGGVGDRGSPGNRASVGDRGGQGGRGDAQRPAVQHNSTRPQAQGRGRQNAGPQGFQGMGDGGRERAAANRGAMSREGQPAARAQAQNRASARPAGGGASFAGGGARAGGARAAGGGGGGGARAAGGGGRGGGGGGGRGGRR
ncbi:DUF3300 domain-containing protein [Roseococcus pinisoli]|uniref:DUF3300 domain-containing protein n=1 Tax=Roseococcus pinisoli TaxID=2835040 RepID=A0ABS5QEV2_9PROT|nr:DUF3300 domain-containing protein [Roseococcus pinisoli]MBS7812224.1 DUF3300 domain-containing protein [Roseococcus pinisoli]